MINDGLMTWWLGWCEWWSHWRQTPATRCSTSRQQQQQQPSVTPTTTGNGKRSRRASRRRVVLVTWLNSTERKQPVSCTVAPPQRHRSKSCDFTEQCLQNCKCTNSHGRRRLFGDAYAMSESVRLWITSKRFKISKYLLHLTIHGCF